MKSPGSRRIRFFPAAMAAAFLAMLSFQPRADSTPVLTVNLVVSSVYASTPTGTVGNTITVNDSIRNLLTGTVAVPFEVSYYLVPGASLPLYTGPSALTTPGSEAIYLGSRTVSGIGASATNSASSVFTLPAGVRDGSYGVLARVDSNSQVLETNENDNMTASSLFTVATTRPDLVFTALTARIETGNVVITSTVKNQGSAPTSGTFDCGYDLVPPGVSSAGQVRAARVELRWTRTRSTALPPGGLWTTTSWFPLTADIKPGEYVVQGVADVTMTQAEKNEWNNMKRTTTVLNIFPDLVITAMSVIRNGTTLTVTDTVKNLRSLPTNGKFRVDYLLVSNSSVSPAGSVGAFFLGSRTISSSLPFNGTNSATTVLAIPPIFSAGSYLLRAYVDGGLAISEFDETNNTKTSWPLSLLPDLVGVSVQVVGIYRSPTAIVLDTAAYIQNNGSATSGPFTATFHLSSDAIIGRADPIVGTWDIPSIPPSSTSLSLFRRTITIPLSPTRLVPAGNYYLGFWADEPLVVPEYSDTNNKAVTGTKIAVP
ncbi:MAG: CARDB domain-containing protein [Planctomycetota bacterium]